MKACFLITIMLCWASLFSFAQVACDSIKKENIYLRKALSLNEPIKEAKQGDIRYAIVKVTGDIKALAVTIEVLISNAGKNLESFGSQVNSISN